MRWRALWLTLLLALAFGPLLVPDHADAISGRLCTTRGICHKVAATACTQQLATQVINAGTASFTVPAHVTVLARIGGWAGGGGGANGVFTTGGGGGQYAEVDNVAVTPGDTIGTTIGTGGAGGAASGSGLAGSAGGDTTVTHSGTTILVAKGGQPGVAGAGGAPGGAAGGGVGTILNNGGAGAANVSGGGGGGGGGAGGPNGAGQPGTLGAATQNPDNSFTAGNGGAGDAGLGGAGGIGSSSATTPGGDGASGTEFGTAGSGGGGGGGAGSSVSTGIPGHSGNFGAGGAGAGFQAGPTFPAGGNGTNGGVVIVYTTCSTSPPPPPPPPSATFFVATTGSDANDGLAATTGGGHGPFLTLGQCQAAMRASTTIKTCTLRAGTYTLGSALSLVHGNDDGETWQFFSADGVNSAVISGGNSTNLFELGNGLTGVTWNGLHMQNFSCNAIHFDTGTGNVANLTIENSEINHNTGGFLCGLISVNGVTGITISHNYFHDSQEMGIRLNAFQVGTHLDNVLIDSNVVIAACETQNDCGGIYLENPQGTDGQAGSIQTETSIQISNNFVRDVGDTADAHDLYFDQGINGAKVFGNIFGSTNPAAGVSTGCFLIDGFNDQFFNNICDTGTTSHDWAGVWWFESPPGFSITGLTYTGNIVLGNYAGASTTNSFGVAGTAFVQQQGTAASYAISGNFYHNYGGGAEQTDGNVKSDASPTHVSAANLQCSGYLYNLAPGSTVLAAGFTDVAAARAAGPPGFTIPSSTNHSCP